MYPLRVLVIGKIPKCCCSMNTWPSALHWSLAIIHLQLYNFLRCVSRTPSPVISKMLFHYKHIWFWMSLLSYETVEAAMTQCCCVLLLVTCVCGFQCAVRENADAKDRAAFLEILGNPAIKMQLLRQISSGLNIWCSKFSFCTLWMSDSICFCFLKSWLLRATKGVVNH